MYDKVCSKCGTKLSQFYNSGYLGCPNCYKAFGEELKSTLIEMHGSTFHTGKKPKYVGIEKELISDYQRYLKEKEKAGIEGRFTDMAKITKILEEISEELKRRGLM